MVASKENAAATKQEEGKNLRWVSDMDQFLIDFLYEEAKDGQKCDKSFKKTSFVEAAKQVSKQFNISCTVANVENRMKTIRKNFKQVKIIEKTNSGMAWDDTSKMWQCSDEVYNDYVRAHPKAKPFLNKPIFMYDELCVVCGDDQATGSFAKSSLDEACEFNEAPEIDIDDMGPPINITQRKTSALSSPPVRKHGKRVRPVDQYCQKMDKLAGAVENVATAIRSSNNSEERIAHLYSEVMKTEGYDESALEEVFDHLVENDKIALSFLVKSMDGRIRWLKKFRSE